MKPSMGEPKLFVALTLIVLYSTIQNVAGIDVFQGLYEYETDSGVESVAAIDLDQRTMYSQLALGTEDGMKAAQNVYSKGAFSMPSAYLTLTTNLVSDIVAGTPVIGTTAEDREVVAIVVADVPAGENILPVRYSVESFSNTNRCSVGGNPNLDTSACFRSTGIVTIGETYEYPYKYDLLKGNYNNQTLASLSTRISDQINFCGYDCNYSTLQKFIDYYGDSYADRWIRAAFDGGSANFTKGDPDFSNFFLEGRAEAILWGTLVLNIWMNVVNRLEGIVSGCEQCEACNEDQVNALDEALALYTGSSEQSATADGGYLLYSVAQRECKKFGTCTGKGGIAAVNSGVFEHFGKLKLMFIEGSCEDADVHLNRIRALMTVPIIQGVLRAAHKLNMHNDSQETTQGMGAAFAAAIQPLVDVCSESNSLMVYNDLTPGRGTAGTYHVVRGAMERSYDCLAITCKDVGGLLRPGGDGYYEDTEPCGSETEETLGSSDVEPSGNDSSDSDSSDEPAQPSSTKSGIKLGLAMGLPIMFGFLILTVTYVKKQRSYKESITRMYASTEPRFGNVKPIV